MTANLAQSRSREFERASSAITLSDMEVYIFPELAYSLVLANLMSPRIWTWLDDPWFDGIQTYKPAKRLRRIRQYIMDHYTFNLDLDTWGLTTKQKELQRFQNIISAEDLARSNALFGYEGDSYYFSIDIRRHFGLDKYTTDTIPYWKTETIEAMDAFRYRPGHLIGSGECVSLAALYAAALYVIGGIPLRDIYMIATPLHSQNYIDLDDGTLTNNRRLVTRSMWYNGTTISQQARRALEHEKISYVAHATGWIHTHYPSATIDPAVYTAFSQKLRTYLHADPTPENEVGFRTKLQSLDIDPTTLTPADYAAQYNQFIHTDPQLPDPAHVTIKQETPIDIPLGATREQITQTLLNLRATNTTVDLAFYALRDLSLSDPAPFLYAALTRNPVSIAATQDTPQDQLIAQIAGLPNESIYDGTNRYAQPDEVWNSQRGDGAERILLLQNILQSRGHTNLHIQAAPGTATLLDSDTILLSLPAQKDASLITSAAPHSALA